MLSRKRDRMITYSQISSMLFYFDSVTYSNEIFSEDNRFSRTILFELCLKFCIRKSFYRYTTIYTPSEVGKRCANSYQKYKNSNAHDVCTLTSHARDNRYYYFLDNQDFETQYKKFSFFYNNNNKR